MKPLLLLLLCLCAPARAGVLLTEVTAYLNGAGLRWQPVEGRADMVRLAVPGPSGTPYLLVVQEIESQRQLLVYAVHERKVPDHRRPAVAEYVARANYGLPIGNLELDFSDGEIRYKTSIDVEGGALTQKMVENLVVINLQTMDRYVGGAMQVAFDNARPAVVIERVEQAP